MYKVDNYKFGEIYVSGDSYYRDLIIFPDNILTNWWRREGHGLCLEDLDEILRRPIGLLIIGTGYNSRMQVTNAMKKELEQLNIKIIAENSRKAVELYNQLVDKRNDIALAIHLTC